VVYDSGENSIYVAGAKERLNPEDAKSWVLKLSAENAELRASQPVNGNVAKSIDISDFPNGSHVYVVSDMNQLYRFDKDLGDRTKLTADSNVEFRSVGARFQNQILTLDLEGNLYRTNPNFGSIGNGGATINLTNGIEFKNDLAISRISYFNDGDPNLALVALNQYGFAITNPTGQNRWVSSKDAESQEIRNRYYISVTGYKPDGQGNPSPRIFAAGIDNDNRPIHRHF
jgi:outer membrane protein assembly factor BamB